MNIHSIYARISPLFRRRRMRWFCNEIQPTRSDRIIDLGGHPGFWAEGKVPSKITLLNVGFPPRFSDDYPDYSFVVGDGCALPFVDGAFDIAFSNSVIEHVGSWERQKQFAAEVRRMARRIWVQTPAQEFFVEPHLIAPFVHWLPRPWQKRLIRHGTLRGWMTKPTPVEVEDFLNEVRLIKRQEMSELFPDCEILTERFLGMAKSYIAIRRA